MITQQNTWFMHHLLHNVINEWIGNLLSVGPWYLRDCPFIGQPPPPSSLSIIAVCDQGCRCQPSQVVTYKPCKIHIMIALYRVRKLNPSSEQSFSKNAINQLFFNIFLWNLQVMFIGSCLIHLLKEIAAGSHHGLNSLAETPAGLRHYVPGEGGHHLRDLPPWESPQFCVGLC